MNNLSFTLSEGEVLQVLGPNGIGKSTLLRALAGLEIPSGGYIAMDAGASLLFHPQPAPLWAELSAQDNLAFWGALEGCSATKIDESISLLQLKPLLFKKLTKLSLGEQQRLSLARLIISASTIWILDEPTSYLDTNYTKLFWHLVKQHTQREGTVVVATHSPHKAWPALILEPSFRTSENVL